ncbi:hypothetical protein ARMSODRAFT_1009355 [Armillaria solidipes]|uniref:Uncharacterized protein n=1 Tax=Armillaria solidipes TaxID=1076256 RepID=A0A2H3ARR0_9AGAR|nr:hypothetical protein ARMSODRAFT_1009355 [Armillaria solidipes]
MAPAHAPCPPVFVGDDNPPFEGMFEFPGTGTREEGKGSQTTPFKVILQVFQPGSPMWRRFSFGRQTRLLKPHDGRTVRKKNDPTFPGMVLVIVVASDMEDMNGFLEQVRINALEHLNSAPSVGMHDVPRESIWALGRRAIPRTNWMNG